MIEKTNQIPTMNQYNLVIANAHKFGTTTNVDISRIPKIFDFVIVDEAHHYPAHTWKRIIDHFSRSKKLFLTATPTHRNRPIIENQKASICYQLSRTDLVQQNIVRNLMFLDVGNLEDSFEEQVRVRKLKYSLKKTLSLLNFDI